MFRSRMAAVLAGFLICSMLLSCGSNAVAAQSTTEPTVSETELPRQTVETAAATLPVPRETEAERDGAQRSASEGDATGFVLLSDAIPDAILEIRYYSTYNFIGDRIDGYEEPCALLTAEAAQALRAVSDEAITMGYRLKIFDAYRPQMAVDHFVRWAQEETDTRMKAYFYPELEKRALFPQGYIASRSGHSRGSTVDLTLFDMAAGREVDMGGPYDFFGELSHPDYAGISEQQQANRKLLQELMVRHGFRPLSTEWWHFTLQDEPYPDLYFVFPVCEASVAREMEPEKGP